MKVSVVDYALSCASGGSTEEAMNSIFGGKSGIAEESGRFIGRVSASLGSLPGQFLEFDTRQARLAVHVVKMIAPSIFRAREKWGPKRVAVLLGTSTGGIEWVEANYTPGTRDVVSSLDGGACNKQAFGAASYVVQNMFELEGPAYAISTACSSSSHVFGAAKRLIHSDRVDAVVVLGVDTLCHVTIEGFLGLGLLASSLCRPFDVARDGINIGEAGAAFLLERDLDAEFHLCGFGASSDGYHSTRPPPDGAGAALCMQAALEDAGLLPQNVVGVHTHGTGTVENDRAEGRAITGVFGAGMSVVSTKGATGHTLGACGALNAAIALESLRRQCLPGTHGLEVIDPVLSVNADSAPRPVTGDYVASNSFAFGGNNVTLILGRS
ncbi:beta-ketoacyl-[acyl-carrier-protein] synthase II [Microvenator marinus]|jgi:3-oxoacyl-[acyl-carrier-protein] synthase-1|uniref:Beta-ketoacyl-[acyl-carrier-protein] synthase II n=1 Tax=Microvenator marinus TaxID=2600177 RepID=A0A5B8XS81_9DELT|nr:beta-ketoacyl synthase N-terminal-like domain-containing protein [Microvenator marinus]QED28375.1 beta-ketoacyl-[acyl-carrier-protein] synthase II [Microvenator marinus]